MLHTPEVLPAERIALAQLLILPLTTGIVEGKDYAPPLHCGAIKIFPFQAVCTGEESHPSPKQAP